MLVELSITNFALIDTLRLRLGQRFNVFTGETGAGKSILLDAVSALVGERAGADVVRAGAERAVVEGVFDVSALLARLEAMPEPETAGEEEREGGDVPATTLGGLLADLGIEPEDGLLILSREIVRTGRGLTRANGRTLPLSALQRIAAFLVDIHGQSAHLTLLRPEQHVFYLDRYAGAEELRGRVGALVAEWRAVRRELERLRRDERELERRVELLRYQVDEIEGASLRSGELEELERERKRLANAERLGELAAALHGALAGGEDDAPGAMDLLASAERTLGELVRLDPTLSEHTETLEQALALLEDVSAAARDYQDELAVDPGRQAEVEERWDLVARLRRKYGATIEEILAFAVSASRELEELANREERAAELETREGAFRERIGALAGQLSERRRRAGEQLGAAMERELADLNMQRARFQTQLEHAPDPNGVLLDGQTVAFSATGIDRVEFLIAPNPGEPLKPLARIASGGETSRLMLALKTILAHADAVPILIFDEIDAGISGRSAQVVGEKLWELGRSHQVLCVTHLPQIAALGDRHFSVAKDVVGDRTRTSVEALSAEQRTDELGQMLGGARTRAAQANAGDLLDRATAWKQEHESQRGDKTHRARR
jgi:DNA repair protein RecN (Recombination protein N)